MSGRPRVLIVKPVLPYPPDQGTKVVSFDLIEGLSQWCDVTVLARILEREEEVQAQRLEEHCHRVVTVFAPNRRNLFTRVLFKIGYGIRSLVTRRSIKSLYDCPGKLVEAARELAAENFDLVIVEYWQLYPLFDEFDPQRLVLFTHDIDLLVNRQEALLERNLVRKVISVRRWMKEQREEVKAYQSVRNVFALTERDAAAVRKLSKDRAAVDVLPFGIDDGADAPATEEHERRRDEILFMGAMSASFNRDALTYFVERIVPHLDDVDADISIVGGALPVRIEWFGRAPRVDVVGRVADVAPYLHRATCIVIPMRFGGGLRIRILEAMAAGLPIVCTSVAMAGMDFEPERDYLLADEPADFAGQVRRLLDDPDLGRAIAGSARERVVSRYGRTAQRERLNTLLQRLVNK